MKLLKISLFFSLFLYFSNVTAQTTSSNSTTLPPAQEAFWNSLLSHCGNAYKGAFNAEFPPPDFEGKELIMYVMSCSDNVIKIPFYVGDNRSRTWVLTKTENGIQLQHDHRYDDGSPEELTMYGGHTSNSGAPYAQFFPADQETTELIPPASANLWWMTIIDSEFTYNLRRVTGSVLFSVAFDLKNPIETPEKPWGH